MNILRFTLAATLLAAPTVAQEKPIAIQAGKIITMTGDVIENGTILIKSGQIAAIGTEVELPWDAVVHEYPDLVAFPGFVEAHTSEGMDRSNESLEVVPFLNVRDSIDPVNVYFQDALRSGLTTINVQQGRQTIIGANGRVVKPIGPPHTFTVEEMTVRPESGLKIAISPKGGRSRATQAQELRKAFFKLRQHLEELVTESQDGKSYAEREALAQGRELEEDKEGAKGRAMGGSAWKVEGLEAVPRNKIDNKLVALLDLVEGRVGAFLWCSSPVDVHTAIKLATENGFLERSTFVITDDCWKAADALAASGRPVVLSGDLYHTQRDVRTGDEIKTFIPKVLQDAGILFSLESSNSSTGSPWYRAATCVAGGLSREQALATVTTNPAQILGLSNRVGDLSVGKDANVLLLDGDPLSIRTTLQFAFVEGDLLYDRSQDKRMKHLITGEEPENTAPETGEQALPPIDGAKPEEEKEEEKTGKDL